MSGAPGLVSGAKRILDPGRALSPLPPPPLLFPVPGGRKRSATVPRSDPSSSTLIV